MRLDNKINVLVVDDSAFMRKVISDMLESDKRIHVVATARNGEDALKKLKSITPDVITLDVEMPVMDGLTTLKHIMKTKPVPVIMVSSLTMEGAKETIKAFEYGAVDFIAKTSGAISLDLYKIKTDLIEKVLLASKVKIDNVIPTTSSLNQYIRIHKDQSSQSKSELTESTTLVSSKNKTTLPKIVAIGTSTGGPKALQQVITKLPKNLNAPVFIVQHMPAGFTKSLADRLNSLSEIEVKEATHGEEVKNGVAYIAPGGYHLEVKKVGSKLMIHIDESPPRRGHRPSVDVMFESLTRLKGYEIITVIMTGMGSDGTEGLLALKKEGNCFAIAESEESSVVFGMPKSAIKTEKVDEVVHLKEIANRIIIQCS